MPWSRPKHLANMINDDEIDVELGSHRTSNQFQQDENVEHVEELWYRGILKGFAK